MHNSSGATFPGFPHDVAKKRYMSRADVTKDEGVLQVPSSHHYTAVDAVMQTAVDAVMLPRTLFQVTCSRSHPEEAHGLVAASNVCFFSALRGGLCE